MVDKLAEQNRGVRPKNPLIEIQKLRDKYRGDKPWLWDPGWSPFPPSVDGEKIRARSREMERRAQEKLMEFTTRFAEDDWSTRVSVESIEGERNLEHYATRFGDYDY